MASSSSWHTFSDATYNVEDVYNSSVHEAISNTPTLVQDYIDSLLASKEEYYQPFPENELQEDDIDQILHGSFSSSEATTPTQASKVEEVVSCPVVSVDEIENATPAKEEQENDDDGRDGEFLPEGQPARKPKTRASLVPSSVATQQHEVKNGYQVWNGVVNAARAGSDSFSNILSDVLDHVTHSKTVIGILPFAVTPDQRLKCLADHQMGASRWPSIDRCDAVFKTRDGLVRHIKTVHLYDVERGDANTREWVQRQRAALATHQANGAGNQGSSTQSSTQNPASTSQAGPSRRVKTKTRRAKPY